MDLHLKGKSVIVTAASKGLGKASALEFAKEGAHVLISSRNEEDLKITKEEIIEISGNENVKYAVCDVTSADQIKEMAARALEWNGKIDVLINNAGGPPAGDFNDFADADWQYAFELNLLSFIRTIREVLPSMRKQQSGRIINIASSSIKQPIDHLILSNTFRAGVAGLAKSLSQELAPDNILINTVGPGRIATGRVASLDEGNASRQGRSVEEVRKENEQALPIKRYGEPEEFAKSIVFLASEGNTYMTGQSLLIDGGLVKAL
ncbi:SDR family oxidoreductase [Halobacillus sp. Marseille-Q1614]|uniref:SDR family oxidoreductase n=1 Tax=Halobacillus sp. Marseille-Q1614 TaxID=2709134 RepID=UPI00156E33C9|nr:SDR family oxidoreductase [Halobacillus sp. Marseille-Q1614]